MLITREKCTGTRHFFSHAVLHRACWSRKRPEQRRQCRQRRAGVAPEPPDGSYRAAARVQPPVPLLRSSTQSHSDQQRPICKHEEHQIVEKSSKKKRIGTEKTSASSAWMAVMAPVELAAPYSSKSNAECGERGVSWLAQAGGGAHARPPDSDDGSSWVRRTAQSPRGGRWEAQPPRLHA